MTIWYLAISWGVEKEDCGEGEVKVSVVKGRCDGWVGCCEEIW